MFLERYRDRCARTHRQRGERKRDTQRGDKEAEILGSYIKRGKRRGEGRAHTHTHTHTEREREREREREQVRKT
jgi:hypothetical protein